MEHMTTISVKVSSITRDKMRKLKIRPNALRAAVEEKIKEAEFDRAKARLHKLRPTLAKIPIEEVIEGIQDDRGSG